jgi:predicted metal-dependent hydrolase
MKTRWGSCTPGGTITLNLHLIKAPRRCIEYVILHELCHLINHKHDTKFYQLLNSMMPNWKKWKEKLEITLS